MNGYIGLSGKFVLTNLYNLINVYCIIKFKSSAFQFSFNIGMNFPNNAILQVIFQRGMCVRDSQFSCSKYRDEMVKVLLLFYYIFGCRSK